MGALVLPSLAGCGLSPTGSPLSGGADALSEAQSAKSERLAREFAQKVQVRFEGPVVVKGDVVTLHYQLMAPTVYDFSKAPRKGTVRISSKDYDLELPLDKVMQTVEIDMLPAFVVPIAIEMAIGAAKGLSIYWLTHRGEAFNRQEAIKATAVGMAASLIPFASGIPIVDQLLPLAVSILATSKSLHYKDIAASAMGKVDQIVALISSIQWPRKSKKA
ncbi:hypothetical protein D3C86_975760 [compost metagenome]